MLWTSKKPSLKHFHILGCLAEARPYRPNEDKLDSRTNNCYFIEYFERSRGYKFYDPIVKAVFETGTATFFKDVEFFFLGGGNGNKVRDIVFEDDESFSAPSITLNYVQVPIINQGTNMEQDNVDLTHTK